MSDVKILIACHKDAFIPDNQLLCPIQVGASSSATRLKHMLHDDVGENISEKNSSFCEMTAIYWAWKNLEADYYGLFHYRRYFSFANELFPQNFFAEAAMLNIQGSLKKIKIDESVMRSVIEQFDIIAPTQGRFTDPRLTVYKQYAIAPMHQVRDLDFVLEYIDEKYPEMKSASKEAMGSNYGYYCNMFIMKKELFHEYCSFIFDVLFAFDDAIDYRDYDIEQQRVLGYLAERITGIWLTYKKNTGKYRFKELQRIYFENTEKIQSLCPISNENNIAIALAADDYYVPYLSTLLQSIADNSSDDYIYDINIFNKNISARNKELIASQFENYTHIKLRYFDTALYVERLAGIFTRGHFRIETYFRLFLQEIMTGYDKVLYLDSDMVVESDVAELFATDVSGYLMAACKDPDTAGLYRGQFENGRKEYTDNILKLERPYDYFQAGTIVFNLAQMRKEFDVDQVLAFAKSYDWKLLDQDVLNYLAQGKVKFIDMAWNVMYDWRYIRINEIIKRAPAYLYREYMEARKSPKIIHFAGPEKPWMDAESDFATQFWCYARKTPFYEIMLSRMNIWLMDRRSLSVPSLRSKLAKTKPILLPIINRFMPEGTIRREQFHKMADKVLHR